MTNPEFMKQDIQGPHILNYARVHPAQTGGPDLTTFNVPVVTPVQPPLRHNDTGTTPYTYPSAMGIPTPTVSAATRGDTITDNVTPPVIARLRLWTFSAYMNRSRI